jgi:hypothetical protein
MAAGRLSLTLRAGAPGTWHAIKLLGWSYVLAIVDDSARRKLRTMTPGEDLGCGSVSRFRLQRRCRPPGGLRLEPGPLLTVPGAV